MLKTKNKFYKGKLTCKLCHQDYKHLGSHLWHRHGMLARAYKERFELPYQEALISEDIYHKEKKAFEKHRSANLKNIYEGGKKNRFRKGHSGLRRISVSERKRIIKRIVGENKKRGKFAGCPVCKIKYLHVESHLYNKHRLIKV